MIPGESSESLETGPWPGQGEQELSLNGARRHLKALQRKARQQKAERKRIEDAQAAHANANVIELDPEPDPKRRRMDSDPEPIVRLISEDLSDIP
eukprot:Skav216714  [mRNA]  locus=scaffold91:689976:691077:- [translate_table: standard]